MLPTKPAPLLTSILNFFQLLILNLFVKLFLYLTQLVANYLHSYFGQQKLLYTLCNIQSKIFERSLFLLADLKDTKEFFKHIFMPVQSIAVHKIIFVCNENSTKSSIFIVPLKHCFVVEIFLPLILTTLALIYCTILFVHHLTHKCIFAISRSFLLPLFLSILLHCRNAIK